MNEHQEKLQSEWEELAGWAKARIEEALPEAKYYSPSVDLTCRDVRIAWTKPRYRYAYGWIESTLGLNVTMYAYPLRTFSYTYKFDTQDEKMLARVIAKIQELADRKKDQDEIRRQQEEQIKENNQLMKEAFPSLPEGVGLVRNHQAGTYNLTYEEWGLSEQRVRGILTFLRGEPHDKGRSARIPEEVAQASPPE